MKQRAGLTPLYEV